MRIRKLKRKIKGLLYRAILVCEHCGCQYEDNAYNNQYFIRVALPKRECPTCGKTGGTNNG